MPRLNKTEETIPAISPAASIFGNYPLGDLQVSPRSGDKCLTNQSKARGCRPSSRKEPVKKSLLVLPIALIVMAMALTACGGGSSSSSSSGGEDAAIEEAIETSATGTDPSKCSEVQTEAFNETESGKTGAAALKACEEATEEEAGEAAESVNVSNVEVEGEEAAAEAEIEGSSLNGQVIAIGLNKEDGDWKLDSLIGFTKYDPAGLAEALEGKLGEEEGITPELATCISEGVAEMSKGEAEALVFEKDNEGIEEIAASCSE
jgi:hypothetical protein